MKKRLLSLACAAAMSFGVLASPIAESGVLSGLFGNRITARAEEITEGDYVYEVLSDGSVGIFKYIGSDSEVIVPTVIDNKPVAEIYANAFCNNGVWHEEGTEVTFVDITKVTIPEGVKTVHSYAFSGCEKLKTVIIPDKVWNTGGVNGFSNTPSDMEVYAYKTQGDGTIQITHYYGSKSDLTIPSELCGKKVTSIGDKAFCGNNYLVSVSMPSSVTEICAGSFSGCSSLEEITIGSGVKTIGKAAFEGCEFKSVSIPPSVTEICDGAFAYCQRLKEVNIGSGVKTIGAGAFESCGLTSIIIPDNVTSIGENAFRDCDSLENITLGKGLKTIGDYAFCFHCFYDDTLYGPSTRTVTIPGNVTSIGKKAFGYYQEIGTKKFYGLDNYTVYGELDSAAETYAKENGFKFKEVCDYSYTVLEDDTVSIDWYQGSDKEVTIPSFIDRKPVTQIAYFAQYNDMITSVTIPDSVTEIGEGAFLGCRSLKTIRIPDSCTSIGDEAFGDCTSLTSVTIPDSVTYIGNNVFRDCASLETVSIGKNAQINGNIFIGCKKLRNIIIDDENNNLALIDGALYAVDYYGMDSDNVYLLCCPEYKTSIDLPKNFTGFGNGNSGYSYITDSAFSGDDLTMINVDPENEIYYSKDGILFSNGSNYSPEYTYNGIHLSGDNLVVCPRGKTNAVIPDGTTWINDKAFMCCKKLTSVTIPDSVIFIGSYAFYDCNNLKSINIPDSVMYIESDAFSYCTRLTSITIPDGVTSIDYWTFSNCTSLTNVTIPDSVTSICEYAFYKCENLKTLIIPKSVTSIQGFIRLTTIYGYRDTEAERYANKWGITFIPLDGVKKGDIDGNGAIASSDILKVKAYIKGTGPLTEEEFAAADIDGDGNVNTADLLKMKAHMKGITRLW